MFSWLFRLFSQTKSAEVLGVESSEALAGYRPSTNSRACTENVDLKLTFDALGKEDMLWEEYDE